MFGTNNNDPSKTPPSARRNQNEGRSGESGAVHQPGTQAADDIEARLNRLLQRLPNAPISSNFTARVVSQARLEAGSKPMRLWFADWESFSESFLTVGAARRLAVAAGVVVISVLSVSQYRASARAEVARSVAVVSNLAALPSVDVLMHFDAINRLPEIPQSRELDVELLAALK